MYARIPQRSIRTAGMVAQASFAVDVPVRDRLIRPLNRNGVSTLTVAAKATSGQAREVLVTHPDCCKRLPSGNDCLTVNDSLQFVLLRRHQITTDAETRSLEAWLLAFVELFKN